jgi:hypothetical protein
MAMIRGLIDGERRGEVLAELARGRMRSKVADLPQALEGRFDDHHALNPSGSSPGSKLSATRSSSTPPPELLRTRLRCAAPGAAAR